MTPSTIPGHIHNFLDPEHPVLTATEIEIIHHLSGHIVVNRHLQHGIDLMQRIVAENAALSEPRHGMMIGEAGCGKTTLVDILKTHLPERDEEFRLGIRADIPALTLSLPARITPRTMARQMLRALGDKTALHGTCAELTERLCRLIKDCNVRLIVVDEFQHLLSLGRQNRNGATARMIESRNWIKTVINETHVSVIIMGMPETLSLVDGEDQLERRFPHLHVLEPFDVPTKTNTEMVDFVDELLHEACSAIPQFTGAEFLCERPADASRLFAATAGVPSRLKDLLIRAALCAHRRHSSVITMVDFTLGFEQSHRSRLIVAAGEKRRANRKSLLKALDGRVINPFAAGTDEINQLIMKMAA